MKNNLMCTLWFKSLLLFSKDALNWSEGTVKTFIMLQKKYFSNKCCLSLKTFYSVKNRDKMHHSACFDIIFVVLLKMYKMNFFMKQKSHKNIKLHNCFQHW